MFIIKAGEINMIYEYKLSTPKEDFYNITPQVRETIAKSGVSVGRSER